MELFEQRITKGDPDTIQKRISYLRRIINREIPLKPGQMEWLSSPCTIADNVKETEGLFTEIGKGVYGKVFTVCIDNLCDYRFVLKEVEYKNSPGNLYLTNDNPYRSENIEVRIFRLLNDLVYIGATPHIPLYLGDFTCDIKDKHYRYLMVEQLDTNFMKIIRNDNNDEVLRNILFQVLYTVNIIQKRYSGFIHNDLKLDNILAFNPITYNDGKYYRYTINGTDYYLPNSYRIALWDFGLSSIICMDCNNMTVEDILADQKLGIQTEKNNYKDVFKLFSYLRRVGVSAETNNFITKYLYQTKNMDEFLNLIPNIEPYTIDEMLKDGYFRTFQNGKNEIDIIESYSDTSVVSNFRGITENSEISKELTFDCSLYVDNKIAYFSYKNPIYNDPYRSNCLSTSNFSDILNTNDPDYLSVISGLTRNTKLKEYKDGILELGDMNIQKFNEISIEDKYKIIDIYIELITKFVNYTYVPLVDDKRIISLAMMVVILSKSVFIVTGIHYQIEFTLNSRYLDYIVQFNKFLCY